MNATLSDVNRFLDKVLIGSCYTWTANRGSHGYGMFWLNGAKRLAHRVAYEFVHGPIPTGLDIDHLCRNPLCVNPAHLEAVTHAENVRRGVGPSAIAAARDTCAHGHPYDEANTYTKRGYRECRACHRASEQRRHRKGLKR